MNLVLTAADIELILWAVKYRKKRISQSIRASIRKGNAEFIVRDECNYKMASDLLDKILAQVPCDFKVPGNFLSDLDHLD